MKILKRLLLALALVPLAFGFCLASITTMIIWIVIGGKAFLLLDKYTDWLYSLYK